MKIRLAFFIVLGFATVMLSSCSALNSVSETVGRMGSAATRIVR